MFVLAFILVWFVVVVPKGGCHCKPYRTAAYHIDVFATLGSARGNDRRTPGSKNLFASCELERKKALAHETYAKVKLLVTWAASAYRPLIVFGVVKLWTASAMEMSLAMASTEMYS